MNCFPKCELKKYKPRIIRTRVGSGVENIIGGDINYGWSHTLITLLRVPYLGGIGSTKLVLPKWHKYGILNRVIRVIG